MFQWPDYSTGLCMDPGCGPNKTNDKIQVHTVTNVLSLAPDWFCLLCVARCMAARRWCLVAWRRDHDRDARWIIYELVNRLNFYELYITHSKSEAHLRVCGQPTLHVWTLSQMAGAVVNWCCNERTILQAQRKIPHVRARGRAA